VVSHVLQQRRMAMSDSFLREQLSESFEVTGVAWDWQNSAEDFGFICSPVGVMPVDHGDPEYRSGALLGTHPLVRWHAVTGDLHPQTSGRVPWEIASRSTRRRVQDLLAEHGCEEQLSISYHLGPTTHRAFILARTGRDFSEDDLEIATRLQPVLVGLSRHLALLRTSDADGSWGTCWNLTPREVVVLRLLVDGLSTQAIAHRLGASPRTVHKHLEHVYRKLGVKDRLNAVRAVLTDRAPDGPLPIR
jgi:DNA-binding CsgD family transcriptional regulator